MNSGRDLEDMRTVEKRRRWLAERQSQSPERLRRATMLPNAVRALVAHLQDATPRLDPAHCPQICIRQASFCKYRSVTA